MNHMPYPQPNVSSCFIRGASRWLRKLLWFGLCAAIPLGGIAQEREGTPTPDPFDREVSFIEFLLGEELFAYANLAMEELRTRFPGDQDRLEVAEVMIQLRMGRTEAVEQILARRNLQTDPKAQAILLQLAMTYEAMGRREEASERYSQFLGLIQGREITDPDVLRFFAGAGIRLSAMLQDRGEYAQASQVLRRVIAESDSEAVERKFTILLIQNYIDHALSLQGNARTAPLAEAEKLIRDMLFGSNDNYWFMAAAQNAWIQHLRGETDPALASLNNMATRARELEERMEEMGIPRSEFPRAVMRYVRGTILFDSARSAQRAGDLERARTQAAQAAGQLYNAFLLYEGNDFATRAGLKFEEVRGWVRETFGTDLRAGREDPRATERIFRRQLDLAEELARSGQSEQAENILLGALSQYPMTRYTLGALGTLGRIWSEQERDWEMMALALYVADMFPADPAAANLVRRWGNQMFQKEHEFGIETILGTFGRRFPGHPAAAATLFELGRRARDQGEAELASRFFQDVVEYHPGSAIASNVLFTDAAAALNAQNFEEAVRLFEIVARQAPPGFLRARAAHGIADAKLRMDDPEKRQEGFDGLLALRERLARTPDSPYWRGDDAERTESMLQRVRFDIGTNLIRFARREDSDELRNRAAAELRSFLDDYPDSAWAPNAMHGLGRIQLQQGRFDEAVRLFEQLSDQYPDTDLGRNALFSLVSAALEEDRVEVARDAVRRMIEQPDAYEPEQIMQVGQLMLRNNRYEEALNAFELVVDSDRVVTNPGLRQRISVDLGRAAVGAGRTEKAIEALESLIEEFPNSTLVVDAGILLSDLYIQTEQFEKAEEALRPVARVVNSRRTHTGTARLGLAVGRVAKARGNNSAALGQWYAVGVATPSPDEPEHAPLIRDAIVKSLDIALPLARGGDTRQWMLVDDLARNFQRHFHMDARSEDMGALIREAARHVQR